MINISHNKQLTEFDFWKCYFKLLDLNKFKKDIDQFLFANDVNSLNEYFIRVSNEN